MIDTVWFASNRPVNDTSRVLFISGDDLGQLPRGYHQITVKLEPYGTHHTKMSLLRFKGRGQNFIEGHFGTLFCVCRGAELTRTILVRTVSWKKVELIFCDTFYFLIDFEHVYSNQISRCGFIRYSEG